MRTVTEASGRGSSAQSGSGTWHLHFSGRRLSLGRSGTLAVSRVVDQGVLGLASVLLAWRLGIHGFVPVSALLVLNSFSVVGSDLGLGTELLRRDAGTLAPRSVASVRLVNLGVAVVSAAVGLALPMPASVLVIGGGLVWGASGEAFIRKSALIRLGRMGRAATGEMIGSAVLATALACALLVPASATAIMIAGLVGKHLGESLADQGWRPAFVSGRSRSWEPWLWLNSVLNFAISNVDFVLVAALVSSRAFAVYSLGFRIAAVFVAQVSYVVTRVSLVDFGDAHRERSLERSYAQRRRQMFLFGLGAALVTASISPALLLFLGHQWKDVVGVVVVLACAIPWRMCAGLGLNVLLATDGARRAARWEASRLAVAVAVLAIGGAFGLASFTIAAAVVAIGTAIGYDRAAIRVSPGLGRSWLLIASPAAIAASALAAWVLL